MEPLLLFHSGHMAVCPLGGQRGTRGGLWSPASCPGHAKPPVPPKTGPKAFPSLVQLQLSKAPLASRADGGDPGGTWSSSFIPSNPTCLVGHLAPMRQISARRGAGNPFAGNAPLNIGRPAGHRPRDQGLGRRLAFATAAPPRGILFETQPGLWAQRPPARFALSREGQGESTPTWTLSSSAVPHGSPKQAHPGPNPQNQPSGPRESGCREHDWLLLRPPILRGSSSGWGKGVAGLG